MLEFFEKVVAGRSAKPGGARTLDVIAGAVRSDVPVPQRGSPKAGQPRCPGSSGSTVSGRTGQVSLLRRRSLTKYPPQQLV